VWRAKPFPLPFTWVLQLLKVWGGFNSFAMLLHSELFDVDKEQIQRPQRKAKVRKPRILDAAWEYLASHLQSKQLKTPACLVHSVLCCSEVSKSITECFTVFSGALVSSHINRLTKN